MRDSRDGSYVRFFLVYSRLISLRYSLPVLQVVTLLNSLSTVCDMCGLHAEGIAAAKRGLMLAMKTNVLPGDLGALHYNLGTLYMHNG